MIFSGLVAASLMALGPMGPDKATANPERYRVDLKITQSVDLTPLGQGVMDSEGDASIFVTVTMSDTTGGQLAHVVIDSMTLVATGNIAQQISSSAVDSVRGKFLHAYIVDGKVKGTPTPSDAENPALGLAGSALSALFLGIPEGKGAGDTWADTTRSTPPADGSGGLTSESVTSWTATGMDGDAVVISGTQNGTVSGEMNGQSVSGTVEGTIEATAIPRGLSHAVKITSNNNLEVLVPQAPDVILVKNGSSAVVTALP